MELTHRFTVPASIGDTWAAFSDLESVAGCFPGAALTSVEGDEFKGTCKVKLGPIALVYSGSGTFLERDEDAHRFVMEAKGKDKRGNGTAGAKVIASLTSAGTESTDVEVLTDLAITGKPAQFGRGVMQDVSDKLLHQFVTCLEEKVTGGSGNAAETVETKSPPASSAGAPTSAPGAASSVSAPAAAAEAPVPAAGAPVPAAERPSYTPQAPRAEADSALDLGATILPILLKSYWKPIVGVLVLIFLLRRLFRR